MKLALYYISASFLFVRKSFSRLLNSFLLTTCQPLLRDYNALMYDAQEIENLIQKCIRETEEAQAKKYDPDKADKTAALCLEAQLKISYFIESIELKVKHMKNEISRVEGEKYFEIKSSNTDKKITEVALQQSLAKDPDVVKAKHEYAIAESEAKKFGYIINTLKDAHVFFRTLAKNNPTNGKWSE